MSTAAPYTDRTHAGAILPLLAALPDVLPAPPHALLAYTATLYLRPYLTAAEHRAALHAALARAQAEIGALGRLPPMTAVRADVDRIAQLVAHDTDRTALYRAIWQHAIAGGTAAHVLLAQHACEIAELVDEPALPVALRLGLLLPSGSAAPAPDAAVSPAGAELEQLSRALLGHALGRDAFVDALLLVHAANRGVELTGGWTAPRRLATRLLGDLPACGRAPKRLRAAQGHELARRAVAAGAARAVLAVEAGLAEAESLHNGQRLLLLAAIDRAVTWESTT